MKRLFTFLCVLAIVVTIAVFRVNSARAAEVYTFSGTVTLGESLPVMGAPVAFNYINASGEFSGGPRTTTDGQGRFTLSGSPVAGFTPAKVRLWVTYPTSLVPLGVTTPCGIIMSGLTAIETSAKTCSGIRFKAQSGGGVQSTPMPTLTVTKTPTRSPTPGATATPVRSGKKGIAGPGGCVDAPGLGTLLDRLGAGWFHSWHYCQGSALYWGTGRYVPMIRATHNPTRTQIETICTQRGYVGGYWLIGNEPDNESQDDLTPQAAAEVYGTYIRLIRDVDPTAKIIVGGLQYPEATWATAFRTAWLARWGTVLESEIHGWQVHAYALPNSGESVDQAIARIETKLLQFRGAISGELWVTEFGNYASTQAGLHVLQIMTEWLEQNVDRYAWFYAGEPAGQWAGASLIYPWGTVTTLGQWYARVPIFLAQPTPTVTRTPTVTPTRTPTRTPTVTLTPSLTPTATPYVKPSMVARPAATCASPLQCQQEGVSVQWHLLALLDYLTHWLTHNIGYVIGGIGGAGTVAAVVKRIGRT